MSTTTAQGRNWSVTAGKTFTIFGQKGFVLGDNWVLPSGFGFGFKADPTPVSSDIIELIEADIVDGNEQKIPT